MTRAASRATVHIHSFIDQYNTLKYADNATVKTMAMVSRQPISVQYASAFRVRFMKSSN
ncbi:MAG: hypothetical protein NUV42_02965 [Candidatus Yonathbacteria bacterium]|nr:hypothetical protein [Candidatus Yonathbacteria bacterium]